MSLLRKSSHLDLIVMGSRLTYVRITSIITRVDIFFVLFTSFEFDGHRSKWEKKCRCPWAALVYRHLANDFSFPKVRTFALDGRSFSHIDILRACRERVTGFRGPHPYSVRPRDSFLSPAIGIIIIKKGNRLPSKSTLVCEEQSKSYEWEMFFSYGRKFLRFTMCGCCYPTTMTWNLNAFLEPLKTMSYTGGGMCQRRTRNKRNSGKRFCRIFRNRTLW